MDNLLSKQKQFPCFTGRQAWLAVTQPLALICWGYNWMLVAWCVGRAGGYNVPDIQTGPGERHYLQNKLKILYGTQT